MLSTPAPATASRLISPAPVQSPKSNLRAPHHADYKLPPSLLRRRRSREAERDLACKSEGKHCGSLLLLLKEPRRTTLQSHIECGLRASPSKPDGRN